jgi:uncharacterized membrane protein YagU involved in acid resistance
MTDDAEFFFFLIFLPVLNSTKQKCQLYAFPGFPRFGEIVQHPIKTSDIHIVKEKIVENRSFHIS